MNQRWLSPPTREDKRLKELKLQAELRQLHPDWPAERVRAEAKGKSWTPAPAPAKRKRDRRNKFGRRGGGNRCGHDRHNYVRPKIARNLPSFVYWAIEAFESAARQDRLPYQLNFRFPTKSERDEALRAVVPLMLSWTMVLTQQIARPSKLRPGDLEGYTVDYHLAKDSGIGESRVERVIGTLKDMAWHHFSVGKNGRRCAAQPIEVTDTGERRGRAAIRVWAPQFWRDIGISRTALKAEQKRYEEARHRQAAKPVALEPIYEQLAVSLWDPTSKPRPPP